MYLNNKKHLVIAFGVLLSTASCSKDYLEVQPKGTALEDSYYVNDEQAYSGLIAVYDVVGKESKGFENMVTMFNAASDDHYAGGGGATDGTGIQSFSNYSISPATIPGSYWNDYYQGVFRANILLAKLPGVPMDDATKARFTAEAKALRGYFYFELVRMFKNIPLILEPVESSETYNIEQAAPEAVWAQIEQDLKDALPNLPVTVDLETEAGRVSQGTAMAILGKVYLYEGKNDLAASTLAEVNGTPGGTSKYGYKLLDNFADLFTIAPNFNSEGIFMSSHTSSSNADWGNWGAGDDEGNSINIMVGPRGYSPGDDAPDYVSGWSFNPITQSLYDVLKGDPRFDATVADIKALKDDGKADYSPGYLDTGYFLKKFMPLNSDTSTGGGASALNYNENVYIIRLADTYLMEAEALGGTGARAQALLDAVRARVGLASIPVSLDNIYKERRLELAGEGHRWFDLVRTGRAASVLADRGFTEGKNDILPIPLRETENTLIKQNPNY